MFVALSCEPLPSSFKCPLRPNMALLQMSLVLFVEVQLPVDFVNIANVKS